MNKAELLKKVKELEAKLEAAGLGPYVPESEKTEAQKIDDLKWQVKELQKRTDSRKETFPMFLVLVNGLEEIRIPFELTDLDLSKKWGKDVGPFEVGFKAIFSSDESFGAFTKMLSTFSCC